MSGAIRIRRTSGRSNADLLCELCKDAAPDTTFTYEQLADVLETDTDTAYDARMVCSVVRTANRRLLRQHQRELRNVPGLGFRLAPATEHVELAQHRRSKADRQLHRGLLTLRHVRWSEMDENHVAAHRGVLMVMEGVAAAVGMITQRQERHEEVIENLRQRVEKVERGT